MRVRVASFLLTALAICAASYFTLRLPKNPPGRKEQPSSILGPPEPGVTEVSFQPH